MSIFREHTPKRRNITAAVNKYGDHRSDLRIDYKNRCGYCDGFDSFRFTYFEIDHFIPQNKDKKPFLTIKSNTDYSNLVYSCKACNNAKSNKWPTNDENVPNRNDEGFIDPCNDDYNNHFGRTADGRITYNTKLGEWKYKNLKLHKPQHQIIWKIEELEKLIAEVKVIQTVDPSDTHFKNLLISVYDEFQNYLNKLFNIK
jgi:uncharacterized protein (TIGR02646 family)